MNSAISLAFWKDVGSEDAAFDKQVGATKADQIKTPLACAGLVKNSVGELLVTGADQIALDKGVFFCKGVQQRLGKIDGHRGVPDKLAFLSGALEQLGLLGGLRAEPSRGDERKKGKNPKEA